MQASRALVNLWANGAVPEVELAVQGRGVVPGLAFAEPAKGGGDGGRHAGAPAAASGTWQLQEYSLRGESFRSGMGNEDPLG
eukprot:365083-Chlamydomonas_euryale.AAC.10